MSKVITNLYKLKDEVTNQILEREQKGKPLVKMK
jgi:hypothetical protein